MSRFHGWDFVMLGALAVVTVFEFAWIFTPALTITQLVREFVPTWARWIAWLWLGWHFLIEK